MTERLTPADVKAVQRFGRRFAADQRPDAEAAYAWTVARGTTPEALLGEKIGRFATQHDGPVPAFVMRILAVLECQARA